MPILGAQSLALAANAVEANRTAGARGFWHALDPSLTDEEQGYYDDESQRGKHDVVVLDSTKLLAIAKVTCVARIRLDMPKKLDRDGATIIERGHEPATVVIELQIVTPKQWVQFRDVMDRIWRQPGQSGETATVQKYRDKREEEIAVRAARDAIARSAAVSIYHPVCECKGVTAVVLEEWEGPDIDERGVGFVRLRARQYIPFVHQQKSAARAPKGTTKPTYSPLGNQALNSIPRPVSEIGATARNQAAP